MDSTGSNCSMDNGNSSSSDSGPSRQPTTRACRCKLTWHQSMPCMAWSIASPNRSYMTLRCHEGHTCHQV